MGNSSSELDIRQARMIEQTKLHLENAEAFLEAGAFESTKMSLNEAASALRQLQHDCKIRRGQPRKDLEIQIIYYGSWQSAISGIAAKRTSKPPVTYASLLNNSLAMARKLPLHDHPDSSEFTALLDKIEKWQSE